MSGARARLVLIVEDDKPTGDLLASAINDERGYQAVRVGSANEALDAMTKIDPDLLLLDIRLPGMSGLELYDRVKADPRFRSLPVIFETAGGREHVAELRERGVATYIRKPFDIEELVRFVKRLVPPQSGRAREVPG
ncbi:MAG TPA: response regulator [Candidatus Limnocylindria bacterium]|nr:response regulator [Candidatus Limnocylindria bacterium]